METSTTLRKMMSNSIIKVPAYQRAYSWETPIENAERITHTDVFLSDLEEYSRSSSTSSYYFGHFLFEKKDKFYNVIDGQQRLTTVVIFLSALFAKLSTIRELSEEERVCCEDMVKRYSTIRFETVGYDNDLFIDYVINKTKIDKIGIETESSWRIVRTFDYFKIQLADKPEDYLTKMLLAISDAICTTHQVKDEAQAIQMFIFQNKSRKATHKG